MLAPFAHTVAGHSLAYVYVRTSSHNNLCNVETMQPTFEPSHVRFALPSPMRRIGTAHPVAWPRVLTSYGANATASIWGVQCLLRC